MTNVGRNPARPQPPRRRTLRRGERVAIAVGCIVTLGFWALVLATSDLAHLAAEFRSGVEQGFRIGSFGALDSQRPRSEPRDVWAAEGNPAPTLQRTAPEDPSASVCGLEGSFATSLDTAPRVNWVPGHHWYHPTSRMYGPGAIDPSGFPYCFAHSPEGAVLAASTILTGYYGDREPWFRDWFAYFVAPGEFYDQWQRKAAKAQPYPDDQRIDIVGVKVMNYDYPRDVALVCIAWDLTDSVGSDAGQSCIILEWHDGDWKLSSAADLTLHSTPRGDTPGYLPWSSG